MTNVVELTAKERDIKGKSSRPLAAEGLIPAIVYGPKIKATSLSVDRAAFERLMQHAAVGSTLVDLTIEGHDKPIDVIIKEIRHDEIKGLVQHIDFWAVDMSHTLNTTVAITFDGTAAGERSGGVLMRALHELKVEASPKNLPEHIAVDVSALEIGDAITVADIALPKGVTLHDDPETVVVSVVAPRLEEEVAEVTEGAEVPEVGKETETQAGE